MAGDAAAVLSDARVRGEFQTRLAQFAKEATGSSNRMRRVMLMTDLPSMDLGEATDKGSINQRNVLKHRAALVDELYANPPSPRAIVLAGKS
jgi:feruloyl-CoA synthase